MDGPDGGPKDRLTFFFEAAASAPEGLLAYRRHVVRPWLAHPLHLGPAHAAT
jgi:hypothetical protein